MHANIQAIQFPLSSSEADLRALLSPYRFTVCEDEAAAARAIGVRRQAEMQGADVVDEHDARSWLLIAENAATGEAVGTLRVTTRLLGLLAAEARHTLPADLALPKCFELSRFAVLPTDRGARSAVALGLWKLAYEFCLWMGSECQVACPDADDARAYTAIGFRPVRGSDELLSHDFRRAGTGLRANPFRALFCELDLAEVTLPSRTPLVGLATSSDINHASSYRIAVGA